MNNQRSGKKKKFVIILVITLVLIGMTVYGAVFQPNATAKKKQAAEQAALDVLTPAGNEIFRETANRYGIKRNGQIIADSVWESIREVSDGDLLYFVVGYRDKTKGAQRKQAYEHVANLDEELRYGILDRDGRVVVEPKYTKIDCGVFFTDFRNGESTGAPYPGDYIIFTDWVDDGGKKGERKTRKRVDYLIRKGSWETVCDLGEFYFNSFIGDDYISVWQIDHITETGGAVENVGVCCISQHKVLWNTQGISSSGMECYPGLGFAAKENYKDEKPSVYITMNGKLVRHITEFDPETGVLWAFDSAPFRKADYVLYDFNAERIGDFRLDKNPWHTADGRTVQIVWSDSQGCQLFDFADKTCRNIDGCSKANAWSEGYAAVMNADQKWGYINDRGEFLFPFQFDEAGPFRDGKASVVRGYERLTVYADGSIR